MDLLTRTQNDPYLQNCCYLTNNYFAYQYDSKTDFKKNIKIFNFVPTYDKWCLYCNGEAKLRCIQCKSVYFCNKDCQRRTYSIHKKHCGRDLFTICCNCGKQTIALKCDKCPVRFCSEKCKKEILQTHKDYDCNYFNKTFK